MRLEFARHVEKIDLADYMPEMAGQVIHIWVNPPIGLRVGYYQALHEAAETPGDENNNRVYSLTAELLSQGPEESHWSADEIEKLLEESAQTDPRFWSWLIEMIVTLIETHRGKIKKN